MNCSGRWAPFTDVLLVIVGLKHNSRCLTARVPSHLSLSSPHDSKFLKPAPWVYILTLWSYCQAALLNSITIPVYINLISFWIYVTSEIKALVVTVLPLTLTIHFTLVSDRIQFTYLLYHNVQLSNKTQTFTYNYGISLYTTFVWVFRNPWFLF